MHAEKKWAVVVRYFVIKLFQKDHKKEELYAPYSYDLFSLENSFFL